MVTAEIVLPRGELTNDPGGAVHPIVAHRRRNGAREQSRQSGEDCAAFASVNS
jgi:hypothetical protein